MFIFRDILGEVDLITNLEYFQIVVALYISLMTKHSMQMQCLHRLARLSKLHKSFIVLGMQKIYFIHTQESNTKFAFHQQKYERKLRFNRLCGEFLLSQN